MSGLTLADRIAADLAEDAPKILLTHPGRPQWSILCRVPVDHTEIESIVERANRDKGAFASASLLAQMSLEVRFQGELVGKASGMAGAFADPGLKEALGLPEDALPRDAVRKALRFDGVVIALADKLTDEAHFDSSDQVISEDPTTAG